jgi:hypothetical protein
VTFELGQLTQPELERFVASRHLTQLKYLTAYGKGKAEMSFAALAEIERVRQLLV